MSPGVLGAASLGLALLAVAGYAALVRVPAVRNRPGGYVAVLAVATALGALAVRAAPGRLPLAALATSAVLLAAAAYFNFVYARLPAASGTPAVGAPAPEFSLPDADGRTVGLAAYRGRQPVVLVFYRGGW